MQYLVNPNGEKTAVVISFKEYEHYLQVQEDLEDLRAYDEAIEANDLVPLEEVEKDLDL